METAKTPVIQENSGECPITPEDVLECQTPAQFLASPKFEQFLRIFNRYRQTHRAPATKHDQREWTREMLMQDRTKADEALAFFKTLPLKAPGTLENGNRIQAIAEELVERIGSRLGKLGIARKKNEEADNLKRQAQKATELANEAAKEAEVLFQKKFSHIRW